MRSCAALCMRCGTQRGALGRICLSLQTGGPGFIHTRTHTKFKLAWVGFGLACEMGSELVGWVRHVRKGIELLERILTGSIVIALRLIDSGFSLLFGNFPLFLCFCVFIFFIFFSVFFFCFLPSLSDPGDSKYLFFSRWVAHFRGGKR